MLCTKLILFLIHLTFIENLSGTLHVDSYVNSFRVYINDLEVFRHSNSAPMFSISKVGLHFTERHGNFRINETIEGRPVEMNSYSLSLETGEDGKDIFTANLSNDDNNSRDTVS